MANNYEELVAKLRKMQSVEYCVIASTEDVPAIKIVDEAADAIEDLEFACNRYEKDYKDLCAYLPKWIPVTERLPEEGEIVLACVKCAPDNHLEVRQASRWCDEAGGWGIYEGCVTHWMPLPEPPKEEENHVG